jgi:hypothetical protein
MKARPDDLPEDQASREIAALYREISSEQPSAHHDEAVLAAARADLAAASPRKPWLLRWKLPLALAATAVLTVSLTLTVEREQLHEQSVQTAQETPTVPAASPAPGVATPKAESGPPKAEKEQQTLRREPQSATRTQVQQQSAEAKLIEPAPERAKTAETEDKSANAPVVPQAGTQANQPGNVTTRNAQSGLFSLYNKAIKAAPSSPTPDAERSNIGIRGTAGSVDDLSPQQAQSAASPAPTAVAAKPIAPPPTASEPAPAEAGRRDTNMRRVPVEGRPPAPVAQERAPVPVEERPPVQYALPAPAAKPAFVPEPSPTASAPVFAAAPPPAPAAPPPAPAPAPIAKPDTSGISGTARDTNQQQFDAKATDNAPEAHAPLSPKDWIAKIRALRKAGRETEAQAELKQLRLAYPRFTVPRDLLTPPPATSPPPPPNP